MGTPLTSSQFVRLLQNTMREVSEGAFNGLPGMKDKFYRTIDTDSAWEEFYSIGSLPDIPEFNGQLSWLVKYPGYYIKMEPKEYAAGVLIQRKLIDDKKYDVLNSWASELGESAKRTMEKYAVRPFVYATSTAFDFMTQYEEAVALASNSHTNKSGTSTTNGFDNLGTGALNKTNLAAARLAMRRFRNDISERIDIGDDLAIVCPDALADTAFEMVGTEKGLYVSEGTKNMQYKRFEVIPYMRWDDYDTNDWALVWKSQMKKDLLWLSRIMPEFKTTVDFDTYQTKHAVYFRFGYGWKGWHWIYFNQVS